MPTIIEVDRVETYPCPCCGWLTFAEPPGTYDICRVCNWEDDALQLEFATTLAGGANELTLYDSQRGRRGLQRVSGFEKDPTWRPIDLERDTFEHFDAPARRAPEDPTRLYYWLPTFWRRSEVA